MEQPKTWAWIYERLEGILWELIRRDGPRGLPPLPPLWSDAIRDQLSHELIFRPEVDAAALRAASDGIAPKPLSSEVRYLLALRIGCAHEFLSSLHPGAAKSSPIPDLSDEWSDQRAIEWLLLDLWHWRCDYWMKLVALSRLGQFPFFGVHSSE